MKQDGDTGGPGSGRVGPKILLTNLTRLPSCWLVVLQHCGDSLQTSPRAHRLMVCLASGELGSWGAGELWGGESGRVRSVVGVSRLKGGGDARKERRRVGSFSRSRCSSRPRTRIRVMRSLLLCPWEGWASSDDPNGWGHDWTEGGEQSPVARSPVSRSEADRPRT